MLAAFLEGTLAAHERRALELHVDGCAACRETVGHAAALSGPAAPRVLVRYRLDAEVGRGGMGVVWRAWDLVLERVVAVKLVNAEVDDDTWRQRALREARAMARLHHPNVVAVFDVGEADGEMFIATEFVDGASLDRWQRGRSPEEIIAAYAQAARGLYAAHRIGLVHRDIKPSNILVARDGRVCVGDFGLATTARTGSVVRTPRRAAPVDEAAETVRGGGPLEDPIPAPAAGVSVAAEAGASPAETSRPPVRPLPMLTRAGAVVGTPAYMAPEQMVGDVLDARADQYSLCLALAEALLGEQPMEGATAASLAAKGVDAPWPAIVRGLSVRPQDRFPDLKPLIAALEGHRSAARRRRVRWLAGGAAGALAIAAGTAFALYPESPRDAEPVPYVWTPDQPWFWLGSASGPWRLPRVGTSIALLDDRTAVVGLGDPWARRKPAMHEVVSVDLETGAVGSPITIAGDGERVTDLVRVGGRLLAFGAHADQLAVWHVAGTPVKAIRLDVPEPHDGPASTIQVAPEHDRVLMCAGDVLVVRAARDLAVERRVTLPACTDLQFIEPGRVRVFSEHDVDLSTGEVRPVPPQDSRSIYAGPGGHRLEQLQTNGASDKAEVIRDGRVTQQPFVFDEPRWTSDGVAIVVVSGTLSLRPGPGGTPRSVPLAFTPTTFVVDDRRAVLLGDSVVQVFELASGKASPLPAGALSSNSGVAAHDGAVISIADRLRVWRRGERLLEDPLANASEVEATRAGVLLATTAGAIELWNTETRERHTLWSSDSWVRVLLATVGDDHYFTSERGLERVALDRPARPWLTFRPGLQLVALDLPRQVALESDDELFVVDLQARRAWGWRREDKHCDPPVLAGDQVVVASTPRLEVVKLAAKAESRLYSLGAELPRFVRRTGELVGLQLASNELVAWPIGAPAATVFEIPGVTARVMALDLDDRGYELAIGWDTGAVGWAWLDQVRGHGEPLAVSENHRIKRRCLVGPAREVRLDELDLAIAD